MNDDTRGSMDFMESMIAMMAVVTVTVAFLGVVAYSAATEIDPAGELDRDRFTGTVENGVFVPGYEEYVNELIDWGRATGVSVTVRIPGGFCEVPGPLTVGDMDGAVSSRTFTSLVQFDDGRKVAAVFEVTVCCRATGDSWR